MKKCLICEKGSLESVEDIVLELNGCVFVAKGERCTNCREEFPYEEETQSYLETVSLLSNSETKVQLRKSSKDIKKGRIKVVHSVSDLLKESN